MPQFAYQALDASGRPTSGTLDAASRSEAYRQLDALLLSPLSVT